MALFKMGQRVRIASEMPFCPSQYAYLLGAETTITSERYERYGEIGYRTAATDAHPGCLGVQEQYLTPLTDPKADAFIESIKKMKPYTEPTVKPREVLSSGASHRTNFSPTEKE